MCLLSELKFENQCLCQAGHTSRAQRHTRLVAAVADDTEHLHHRGESRRATRLWGTALLGIPRCLPPCLSRPRSLLPPCLLHEAPAWHLKQRDLRGPAELSRLAAALLGPSGLCDREARAAPRCCTTAPRPLSVTGAGCPTVTATRPQCPSRGRATEASFQPGIY